jgi:uncharacterized membrane protein
MIAALVLHVLAAVIWIGGMFFAYVCLRPVAAAQLQPGPRFALWAAVFERFFPLVWAAVVILPVSGYYLAVLMYEGFMQSLPYVWVMTGGAVAMIAIFLHVWFAPYRRLRQAVAAGDLPAAGAALAQIRRLVGINTMLGLVVVIVATSGRLSGW